MIATDEPVVPGARADDPLTSQLPIGASNERVRRMTLSGAIAFVRRRWPVWAFRLALLAAFVALWEWAVATGRVEKFFVSRPRDVWDFLWTYVGSGEAWKHGSVTAQETLIGFAAGAVLGIAGGVVLARFARLEDVVNPFLAALNALPRVALAPMFILWFGIGQASKVYLAISLVFFVVLLSTEAGIKSVDPELRTTARTLCANERQIFIKVIFPGAVPAIFAGLRLGLINALLGAVVGEMLASQRGLGQQLTLFSGTFEPSGVFGVLALIAAFAMLMDKLMLRLQRRVSRWQSLD